MAPAIRHNISSGKNGKRSIRKNIYLPFVRFSSSFSYESPTIHLASGFPHLRPKWNARSEPKNMPVILKTNDCKGPKSMVPASVVRADGKGIKVTCKNCKTRKKSRLHIPKPCIVSFKCSIFITLYLVYHNRSILANYDARGLILRRFYFVGDKLYGLKKWFSNSDNIIQFISKYFNFAIAYSFIK